MVRLQEQAKFYKFPFQILSCICWGTPEPRLLQMLVRGNCKCQTMAKRIRPKLTDWLELATKKPLEQLKPYWPVVVTSLRQRVL